MPGAFLWPPTLAVVRGAAGFSVVTTPGDDPGLDPAPGQRVAGIPLAFDEAPRPFRPTGW